MVDTSRWGFDAVTTTLLRKPRNKFHKTLSVCNGESFNEVTINVDDHNELHTEKNSISSGEENLKVNPYYNLLQKLAREAEESEETVQKRNEYGEVKHLQLVCTEFCEAIKNVETLNNDDKKFVNPLNPDGLLEMFRCGNPHDLNLCGKINVNIHEDKVIENSQFIESENVE